MSLIARAESAEELLSALKTFRDVIPESAAEITALITELFAVSTTLRKLFDLHNDPRCKYRYPDIADDVLLTLHSFDYTFDDFQTHLGRLDRPSHLSNATIHRRVWRSILDHFQRESGNSLSRRLKICRAFLLELSYELEGLPVDYRRMEDLGWKIDALLETQAARPEALFAGMSLGAPAAPLPRRSFERRRRLPQQSQSPPRRYARRRPLLRPLSPDGFSDEDYFLPRDSEPPTSPTSASWSQSSTNSSGILHWAQALFAQPISTTPFGSIGPSSQCLGEHLPGASHRLSERYEKLVDLPFESGDLMMRLYIRQEDLRVRIHCRVTQPTRSRKECTLPLISLEAVRERSSLLLCRPSRSGNDLNLWACLRFQSYERMVLFFCTFLALKAQDSTNRENGVERYQLQGENEEYGGKIVDDHYHHALRIYRDRESGATRLQASVHSGELRGTPIWTAFITYQVRSLKWMERTGPHKIQLADLNRYIFTDEYVAPVGPNGRPELTFLEAGDANDFWGAIVKMAQLELPDTNR